MRRSYCDFRLVKMVMSIWLRVRRGAGFRGLGGESGKRFGKRFSSPLRAALIAG